MRAVSDVGAGGLGCCGAALWAPARAAAAAGEERERDVARRGETWPGLTTFALLDRLKRRGSGSFPPKKEIVWG